MIRRLLGESVPIGDAILVPLIEQHRDVWLVGGALAYRAERRAVGVLVRRGTAVRAFLADGAECDPRALVDAFPQIAELIGA